MEMKEAFDAWCQLDGVDLVGLRESRSDVIKVINSRDGSYTAKQISDARADKVYMTTRINQLVKNRKELEKCMDNANKIMHAAKAKKKEKDAAWSGKEKWLKMEIECNFFEPYGVKWAAYHGGDYVGPAIKALMANADDIFGALEVFVIDVAIDKGILDEMEKDELCDRIHVYGHTLQHLDGFFSLVCDKESRLTLEQKKVQLKAFLDGAMRCWRMLKMSITPKLHLLEDHLLDMVERFETLEYFDEEFVKRAHQKGIKYNQITKGFNRMPIKKYNYMVKWEMARSLNGVKKSQELLKRKTK